VVVSTVASQHEGSCFETRPGPFCVEFACSPRICMGSPRVLQLPPWSLGWLVNCPSVCVLCPASRPMALPTLRTWIRLSGYREWMENVISTASSLVCTLRWYRGHKSSTNKIRENIVLILIWSRIWITIPSRFDLTCDNLTRCTEVAKIRPIQGCRSHS